MNPPSPGDPIQIRCGRGTKYDPYEWLPAFAGRHTPRSLFYRWEVDGEDCGPLRLDGEGKTWRRQQEDQP